MNDDGDDDSITTQFTVVRYIFFLSFSYFFLSGSFFFFFVSHSLLSAKFYQFRKCVLSSTADGLHVLYVSIKQMSIVWMKVNEKARRYIQMRLITQQT